jgi:hypothetical protein
MSSASMRAKLIGPSCESRRPQGSHRYRFAFGRPAEGYRVSSRLAAKFTWSRNVADLTNHSQIPVIERFMPDPMIEYRIKQAFCPGVEVAPHEQEQGDQHHTGEAAQDQIRCPEPSCVAGCAVGPAKSTDMAFIPRGCLREVGPLATNACVR